MNNIEYIVGDVRFQPFESGYRLIPHVCNDMRRMGAGVAKALYTTWPSVRETYMNSSIELGDSQIVIPEDGTIIFNMIAQHGVMTHRNKDGIAVGEDERPPIRYAKLAQAMERVQIYANTLLEDDDTVVIHCPMFGCDLAGGKWDIVAALIDEIWCPYYPVKVCVIDAKQIPR